MEKNIIKIENKDLVNLKYILSKIKISNIKSYKEIENLLKEYNSKSIDMNTYNSKYGKIVSSSMETLNKFKKNFTELYLCDIIYRKKKGITLEIDKNTFFNNVLRSIQSSLKYDVFPQNIIDSIAKMDTSEIINNTVKLNCRLRLQNSESLPNRMIVDIANNRMDEISKSKIKK